MSEHNLPPWDEQSLDIAPFGSYSLIIDARTPREFNDDHIPGAMNLPVVYEDDFAKVGTLHKSDKHEAYMLGVARSLKNLSEHIPKILASYKPSDRILVYCFRGGKRSKLWHDNLRTIGFKVDKVPGGWKAYRNWVLTGLETLSRQFKYHVITGPTGAGKTRLLKALEEEGAQVLDLEGLASHRGSLIGSVPGVDQPSQKLFDSLLFEKLRSFDQSKCVWVESESKKIGRVQLPTALFEAMHASKLLAIEAPIEERVKLWHEDYGHFKADLHGMLNKMRGVVEIIGRKTFEKWRELAEAENASELFESMMVDYYDRLYKISTKKNYKHLSQATPLSLERLDPESLRAVAKRLIDDEKRAAVIPT